MLIFVTARQARDFEALRAKFSGAVGVDLPSDYLLGQNVTLAYKRTGPLEYELVGGWALVSTGDSRMARLLEHGVEGSDSAERVARMWRQGLVTEVTAFVLERHVSGLESVQAWFRLCWEMATRANPFVLVACKLEAKGLRRLYGTAKLTEVYSGSIDAAKAGLNTHASYYFGLAPRARFLFMPVFAFPYLLRRMLGIRARRNAPTGTSAPASA